MPTQSPTRKNLHISECGTRRLVPVQHSVVAARGLGAWGVWRAGCKQAAPDIRVWHAADGRFHVTLRGRQRAVFAGREDGCRIVAGSEAAAVHMSNCPARSCRIHACATGSNFRPGSQHSAAAAGAHLVGAHEPLHQRSVHLAQAAAVGAAVLHKVPAAEGKTSMRVRR